MPAKQNEIKITRIYEAPVKLVWEAWTDPEQVAKWWGPRGFTLTTKSRDLRPGGKWIYTMHGPDGTDYPNITTYREVVKYEKLVYDHGGSEERDKLFTVTVTFKEEKGQTIMTMIMTLPTAEEAKATKQFIKDANGNSTWDRLAEYLEDQAGKDVFVLNRSFDADIKSVYEMWVHPELFPKWFGPKEVTMSFSKFEPKEGGQVHWSNDMGNGKIYGQLIYKKMEAPNLIIYTQSFCDQNGEFVKLIPNFPDQIQTTVHFHEEEGGETRLTLKWEIFGNATEAERQTFREMRATFNKDWNESLDRFETILQSRK